MKQTTGDQIWRLHTDNSYDYPLPVKKIFGKNVIHQHFPAWKKKFKNNPIERLQNTIKERYKTFRGFNSTETAEKFPDFWTVCCNFIRKHMTLQEKNSCPSCQNQTQPRQEQIQRPHKTPIIPLSEPHTAHKLTCFLEEAL